MYHNDDDDERYTTMKHDEMTNSGQSEIIAQGKDSGRYAPKHLITHDEAFKLVLKNGASKTVEAYAGDYKAFGAWFAVQHNEIPSDDGREECIAFMRYASPDAHAVALRWRHEMEMSGQLSTSTICRRLSAIRALFRIAHQLGLNSYQLTIPGLKQVKVRDTTGPGIDAVQAVLDLAKTSPTPERDSAIVRLAFDIGLRRNEISCLNYEDLIFELFGEENKDFPTRVGVQQKGARSKVDRVLLALPEPTAKILQAYLKVRGTQQGALFVTASFASIGERMSGHSIWQLIVRLGKRAGVNPESGENRMRPHGIRHTAITEVAQASNGDYRKVQGFSRHKNVSTVAIYVDNAAEEQKKAAKAIADRIK